MARRSRNIYKRKDGRFEARYIKARSTEGKAVYGSVYAKTYSEAKIKLEAAKETTKLPPKAHHKAVDIAEKYLETHKNLIKQSTYWVYHGYIENHIRPYFKDMRCDQICQDVMQAFVNEKIESGLSAATVQSIFLFIKKCLEEVIDSSSYQIRLPMHSHNGVDVLTFNEQKRLEIVAKASDPICKIGVILCLYTGIRVGELCGLMWSDIDFAGKQLHVRRTMQRVKAGAGDTKTEIILLPPKSKSSWRSIPLPTFLLNLLKEHRAGSAGDYVLARDGRAVEPRIMQYNFQRLLSKAEVRPVAFHVTRHLFATRALENGFDIKTLSEILGHSSPIITLKKYAHVMDEHKRRSMESMASVFQTDKL